MKCPKCKSEMKETETHKFIKKYVCECGFIRIVEGDGK